MNAKHKTHTGNLIWLDLEMTGLEPETDMILEMALVITNRDLEIIDEGPPIVLACPEEKLDAMDKWNKCTHSGSGLLAAVKQSSITVAEAEKMALEYVGQYVVAGESPMCGNTICQDRRFLARHMRKLHDFFHYRNLDVSSFKLACNWWLAESQRAPVASKNAKHRALADILDSIEEMSYYRNLLY